MSEAWKRLDLEGGGLQNANLRLAKLLKRRRKAYALWAAFPLGLHHDYLENPAGAWLFRVLTALAVALVFFSWRASVAAVLVMAALAVYDLFWIDRRIVAMNKQLRRDVYLSTAPGAPPGFRGRFDDESETSGDASEPARGRGNRVPSFAEQERLLREIAHRKRGEEPGKEGAD